MAFKRDKTIAAAQKAVRKGNLERAIKEYKLLVEDDPADKRMRLKLADIYVKSSRLDEALEEYRHVGKQYLSEDFHEKAAAIYKQALRIAPRDARLHQNLGFAYFQHGRSKDAIRAYSKAERLYNENGETAAHLSILEKMLDVDPGNVGIQIQLAERCEKNGFSERAIEHFESAANQLKEEGRTDEYIQVCERLIFLAPDQTPVRKALIRIYHGRSDNRRALRHLQICFKATPDDIETLELLGSTFHRLGENQKALLVYKQLAQNFQSDPKRSREVYQSILRIDPNDQEAIDILGITQARDHQELEPIPVLHHPSLETDSLAGVTFLDDDDDDEDEDDFSFNAPAATTGQTSIPPTSDSSGFGEDFLDFAEDAMEGFDDFNLSGLDEIPTFRSAGVKPVSPPAPGGEISFLEADSAPEEQPQISSKQLEPLKGGFDRERLDEIMAEAEVFIKYNLLDQAKEVLIKATDFAPDELFPREQFATVLERKGELKNASRQWVEVARIHILSDESQKANASVRRALSAGNDADQVKADIKECGITGRVFLSGAQLPKVNTTPTFDRLDEISTSFIEIEQDPAMTGARELGSGEASEGMLSLDFDVEFDEALTMDSEIFLDDDEDVFDVLFDESEAISKAPPIPGDRPPIPAGGPDLGNISLTNAFQSINATSEPSSANFLNTHLELGATYAQMELYEDAIAEFTLAMKDPSAREAAIMQIALCHIELGDAKSAKENFISLVNNPSTSAESRQAANKHLSEI